MVHHVTVADVISKVRQIAAAHPDHIYDKIGDCVNVETDENGVLVGSCIIGKAIVALGISAAELDQRGLNRHDAEHLLRSLGISLGDLEEAWLLEVQRHQDEGHRWGYAVTAADGKAPALSRCSPLEFDDQDQPR
ncbi:hypothetical protein F5X71_34840 [Nocardia brasiliensis]|uniref:Uncharacterized protein n=1 Tax=Nocardia brasiliensis TaxID=37326 RepID=A0A6G9Y163_NOCBR|nr:hypothetical protein [Nocardia brasiliensis]QIS06803.1 hypothetical protein F5X71_34840 [Nocardia brasiliensis]